MLDDLVAALKVLFAKSQHGKPIKLWASRSGRAGQVHCLWKIATMFLALAVCVSAVARANASEKKKTRNTTSAKSTNQNKEQGRYLYKLNGCADCHRLQHAGPVDGLSLDSVASRRSRSFIVQQLLDPEGHVRKNPAAFQAQPNLMTFPDLSKAEAAAIADYLISLSRPSKAAPRKTSGRK